MVLDRATGDYRDSTVYLCGRRSRDASVELAAAAVVRLANPRLLASACIAGTVPNSIRWTGRPRSRPQAPLAGPLQEDDSGRAGKIPPSPARRLRIRISRREGYVIGSTVRVGTGAFGCLRWWNQKLEPQRTRRKSLHIGLCLREPRVLRGSSFSRQPMPEQLVEINVKLKIPTLSLQTSQGQEWGARFLPSTLLLVPPGLAPARRPRRLSRTWAWLIPTPGPDPASRWLPSGSRRCWRR
jgi:hypothetical protein